MKSRLNGWGLPLLAKELVEQAARPRTYVIRVVYAGLLFATGYLFLSLLLSRYTGSPFAILGQGRELFETLVMLQFAGIYIFMPAMTCSVITTEKERNSLGLLVLTKLGPWTILMEKYLGRVIPMISFLLLCVPLLVVAYSLGGITQTYLWSGIWFMMLTVLQVGALALLCSCFFRTTMAAFIATYVLGIGMLFALPLANAVFGLGLVDLFGGYLGGQWVPCAFFTPVLFEMVSGFTWSGATVTPSGQFGTVLLVSLPILTLTAIFFFLSRVFLLRRAFVSPVNWMLRVFRRLDEFFVKLNDNRYTKGRVLFHDSVQLDALTDPVAWRETTKTSLGAIRYLVRLLILLETPSVVVGLFMIVLGGSNTEITVLTMLLWIVITLIVAAKGTSLVSGERTHETLDVLLTTPLTSREIILQKFRGVKRLIWVLSIPLVTNIALKALVLEGTATGRYTGRGYEYEPIDWLLYLVCSLLAIAVYLPMVAWLSLLLGLRIRSQTKAIFAALGSIVGWCVIPLVMILIWFELLNFGGGLNPRDLVNFALLFSPATIIPLNEAFELEGTFANGWLACFLNFSLYGTILWYLRATCLNNRLDRYLGRATGTDD